MLLRRRLGKRFDFDRPQILPAVPRILRIERDHLQMFRPDPIHPLAAKKRGPVFVPLFPTPHRYPEQVVERFAGRMLLIPVGIARDMHRSEIIGKGNLSPKYRPGGVPPSYAPISSPFLFAISRYFALFSGVQNSCRPRLYFSISGL